MVLEIVEELVEATADEETPQLPRDLNTTNDIITETLDLLFSDLDSTTGQNETNLTVADVCVSVSFISSMFTNTVTGYSSFQSSGQHSVREQPGKF